LINWHINRLLSVGLIKVEKIEMSQKNKQMKYYGPVKTALVIIPPESSSNNGVSISKKESVLMKLRHYMASISAFVVGASGIYLIEKNQAATLESSYVPETANTTMQAAAPMHAALKAAPSITTTSQPSESLILSGDQLMIMFALLGGAIIFCAVFFGMRLARKSKNKKLKQ
ncbi:MAG: hypothetical protein KGI08_09495, partial [Thaumarchaeota archaeon]|nr:hypothetical protein [Nitrososphaerota archaeon]